MASPTFEQNKRFLDESISDNPFQTKRELVRGLEGQGTIHSTAYNHVNRYFDKGLDHGFVHGHKAQAKAHAIRCLEKTISRLQEQTPAGTMRLYAELTGAIKFDESVSDDSVIQISDEEDHTKGNIPWD